MLVFSVEWGAFLQENIAPLNLAPIRNITMLEQELRRNKDFFRLDSEKNVNVVNKNLESYTLQFEDQIEGSCEK